jgi:hypothetical protein
VFNGFCVYVLFLHLVIAAKEMKEIVFLFFKGGMKMKKVILVMIGLMVLAGSANAQPYLLDPFFESPDVDPGFANAALLPDNFGEGGWPVPTNQWDQSYNGPYSYIYEPGDGWAQPAPQGDQVLLNTGYQLNGGQHGSRSNYVTDYILQEGDVITLEYMCYIASSAGQSPNLGVNIMARNWESEGYWDNVGPDMNIRYAWQFVSGSQAPCPADNAGEHLYLQTNSWANYGEGVMFDDIKLYINGEDVTVPEPMTMTLLALGGLVAIRRRR